MNFPQAQARLESAVFDRLGEDATWQGVTGTVRVLRRVFDDTLQLGGAAVIETAVTIRVRKAEVAAPAQGQQVQVLDEAGAPIAEALFVVNGEPTLDRKGVWHCPATPAA